MSDLKGEHRLSATSSEGDHRPVSPLGSQRSIKSFSSTSTLDSIACESAPPLPAVISVRECVLRKRPPNSVGPGWGFVLRGTTSEFAEGTKIYTCHIESVHESGTAKAVGLREGDQIVSIDGVQVRDLEHRNVVKMFQTREKVSLGVLCGNHKSCTQARVTKFNASTLCYLWALMRNLQTLEIINVKLGEDKAREQLAEMNLSVLVSLRSLSVSHCSLTSLDSLTGLSRLMKLESLCLSHNFLTHEELGESCAFSSLIALKKLDLSRNLLRQIPDIISSMSNLEVLVLVDNSISELPMFLAKLTKLHTLCIDCNLLREVDKTLALLPWLQKLTMSNNYLECESQAIRLREFLVTSVEGNPYTKPNEAGMVTRGEPSLRRTLSVRGLLISSRVQKRLSAEWDDRDSSQFSLQDYVTTQ